MDPINLGNGLIKLVSFNSDTKGPFVHLNTNVRDLVTGKVPQNPATPEWAGIATDDPKLDNSIFALTAKIVFLGREFGIFGLIDTTGLMLFTYMGLNVNLPGLKMKAKEQMGVIINNKMFSLSAGFNFDLAIDIPPSCTAGLHLGKYSDITFNLDISMTLQIRYNQGGWQNDGLVYEVAVSNDPCVIVPHKD